MHPISGRDRYAERLFAVAILSLATVIFVRNAWMSDDAYFTFRTIDNLINGHGLRWNAAERVQAYTHPLWLALIAPFYWMTGEPYFTTLAISFALLVAAALFLLKIANRSTAVLAFAVLLLSRAFVDYTASGLENPLTNVLLVAFFWCHLSPAPRPVALSALAVLLVLNRLDAAILVAPAMLVALARVRDRRTWLLIAATLLPLVAWELFSLIYYGFPFPNTAYAKLSTGIAEGELARQGLLYLLDSLRRDPLTLTAIAVASGAAFVSSDRRLRPVALGALAYIAYVVYVGGDFMSGRFLSAPLLCAVVILAAFDLRELGVPVWAPAAVAIVIGLNAPHHTLAPYRDLPGEEILPPSGIADERLFYYPDTGLLRVPRDMSGWPKTMTADQGRELRRTSTPLTMFCCNGLLGYFAGPGVHVIDTVGLGDPLLARLPATHPWRIGHFERPIPGGYVETLRDGINRLTDARLAQYYDRLRVVTRGSIWSRRRFKTIWQMNMGQFDELLDAADDE